jgi:hypothetical protein
MLITFKFKVHRIIVASQLILLIDHCEILGPLIQDFTLCIDLMLISMTLTI